MIWGNPTILYFLWIGPAVAVLMGYAQHRRAAALARFVDPQMAERLMPRSNRSRPWIKMGLVVLGLTLLVLAAARPRFGVYFEEVSSRAVDLFVALDVSRSMLAEDVSPSRLERAKSDILDLLNKLGADRVGLIAFAGQPVVKAPLTTDHGFFRMVLDEIDTDSAPRGGTLIGDAIRKAMEAMPIRRDRDQVIVLITDGEDQDSFPEDAAKAAAERRIKIFTVGLGDPGEGSRIPIRDEAGSLTYIKDTQGAEVWSRLDERTLQTIALVTDGAYIPAQTHAYDLGQVYENHLASLARSESQSEKRKRYRERFQLLACFGLILLVIDMVVPNYEKQRLPT